jgi:CubicO group peptidase (beta-lactamase class C family)
MTFPIHGTVAPGFEPVADVFTANFVDGIEVGAGFSAVHRGRVLVDLWGGFADAAMTRPWQRDTLVNVYSTTKGVAAAAVAALVSAGALDYDAPVSRYWPELGAARDGLTISGLLSHQAGLCAVDEALSVADLLDWAAMCRRLERQQPYWPPGSAAGYHAVTWGFLVGELVRRATGRTLGQELRARIAEPLEADVHIGLPVAEHHRVADLIGPNRARKPAAAAADTGPPTPLHGRAMANPLIRPYADACSAAWRSAELAASNGHADARGIARIYAALAAGGVLDGVRIATPATVIALRREVWGRTPDLVLGYPMRRGRGVNLNTAAELGPEPDAFGHTGTGGSLGFADPRRGLGIGYVMNQLWNGGAQSRSGRLVAALYDCLNRVAPPG